jgi:hypothetical protein
LRKITLEQYQKTKQLIQEGVSLRRISKIVKLNNNSVRFIKYGYYEVRNGSVRRKAKFTDAELNQQRKLRTPCESHPSRAEEFDFYEKHSVVPELETWNGDANHIAVQLNEDYYARYVEMRHYRMYHPNEANPLFIQESDAQSRPKHDTRNRKRT